MPINPLGYSCIKELQRDNLWHAYNMPINFYSGQYWNFFLLLPDFANSLPGKQQKNVNFANLILILFIVSDLCRYSYQVWIDQMDFKLLCNLFNTNSSNIPLNPLDPPSPFLLMVTKVCFKKMVTHLLLYTLLVNEGIPRALKGKKLRLKNILLVPLIFEEMNSF